ncbi:hypothetical protein PIB30_045265 [Stylosanthes scabra]|uniref:Methyltransferase type 11 domain-containing protein n=1 Tax=Stylosanthes scabra TaxID=79078 RepID=A0ABU6QGQ4_9FABA|nr:hypothetical protein [Stylosanthes scabra]
MDAKAMKLQILKGSIARRVFFRSIMLASAISIVSLLRAFSAFDLAPVTFTDCIPAGSESRFENATLQSRVLSTFWSSFYCERDENLTVNVVNELLNKQLLDCGAKSLCVGEGSTMAVAAMKHMGFSSVAGVHRRHRFFSLKQKKIVYELDYQDCSFDFVLSRDLDRVSVPALLVLEVERVLKPGGVGALLVGPTGSNSIPNDLIRSATPVSSLLRSSTVLHVGSVGDLNLVVFRKRVENATTASAAFYNQHPLPKDCSSISLTKPLIQLMEPLVSEKPPLGYEKMVPYLPKFVDVSSRKRMVYIDINGGGEILNANDDHNDWFLPSYPVDQRNFNVYFVHYNTSVMLSYVKRPGVTFVYYPGLAGKVAAKANLDDDAADDDSDDDGDLEPFVGEDEFDFLAWFKETVQYADFVVLKMNAGNVEMKFLWDVFESGAICFVDELFLRCPESGNDDDKTVMGKENCMDIYEGLRSNGVYVHQWWGN